MKIVDFLQQNQNDRILHCKSAHFSRAEYEAHEQNVCSLLTEGYKPNIKMLQVPFCISLWTVENNRAFHSYSLSNSSRSGYSVDLNAPGFPSSQASSTLHQHNYYEFIYIYNGRYTHSINGKTYSYSENQFLMLEPGIFHQETYQDDSTILFFCASRTFFDTLKDKPFFRDLAPDYAPAPESSIQFFSYKPVLSESAASARLLAEQLVQEIVQGQPGSDLISEGLFYRLVGILLHPKFYTCKKHVISIKAQERLNTSEELQAYLWARNGQATRKEITEQFNYCADYLNRLLKRQTGWTISKYNQHIAIKRAEQLLRETDMSVADIISELGFENRSFFYRLFRESIGITLSEYRSQEKAKRQKVEM